MIGTTEGTPVMNREIERRFLVQGDDWKKEAVSSLPYCQKYLPLREPGKGIVRVRTAGDRGFLTLKTCFRDGVRNEYEYEIPLKDAISMMDEMGSGYPVKKIRYIVPQGDLKWEIDVFQEWNEGLVLAEIEIPSPDFPLVLPAWTGQEITGNGKAGNASLAFHPFTLWSSEEKAFFSGKV